MIDLAALPEKEIIPGFRARFVHSERSTLAFWTVEKGAVLPMHSHPHEQITQVLEGRFELTVGDETRVCEPGFVRVIPGGVAHGGRALTDCQIFDLFSPVREDYR